MVKGIRTTGRIDCGKDGSTVKKLIALLLVAAFVTIGAVGCGSGDTKPTTKPATPATSK